MARIEKTVFISYRRKDISWALAVYQYLTSQRYDVFFDYTHIPSGDFEQIIVSNIKARAHFVLILTPTALDRTSNEGDWLRREIETAMDEKRNIVPLFFDGFSFGLPNVAEKLTGRLADVKRYNGLDIPSGYFPEAMERLRTRYLNVPLNSVIHPISTQVRKKVKEEKVAANKALREQKEDIQELVKPAQEKPVKRKRSSYKELSAPIFSRWKNATEGISSWLKKIGIRKFGIGISVMLIVTLGVFGVNSLIENLGNEEAPSPTQTNKPLIEFSITPEKLDPTVTATVTIAPAPVTPSITPTSKYSIGSTMTGKDGMTLLYVPAGDFDMGSENTRSDEIPIHTVYLDAFWIDQTEVTNAMYAMCVKDGVCDEPSNKSSYTRNNYYGNSEFNNYPRDIVLWDESNIYCEWADRRLPTEAEWEKAARGENAFTYPWGNDEPNNILLNYSGDIGDTTEVGSYPSGASPYGALDMAGNVGEWVADWYDGDYYGKSPTINPAGPLTGKTRVNRGGSWINGFIDDSIRSAFREHGLPTMTGVGRGFRCAMDAE